MTGRHRLDRADKQLVNLGWHGSVYDSKELRRARRWRAFGYTMLTLGLILLAGLVAFVVVMSRLHGGFH